jgi:hypothetical protein
LDRRSQMTYQTISKLSYMILIGSPFQKSVFKEIKFFNKNSNLAKDNLKKIL